MIRTYYWADRSATRRDRLRARLSGRASDEFLLHGNAGDIFAATLLRHVYGAPVRNHSDGGHRLLTIGSVAHRIQHGDVVCGIGAKNRPIPASSEAPCTIRAVRGPITAARFERAGHSLDQLRSLLDPGLMLRFMVEDLDAEPSRRVFIPHYRERVRYRGSLPDGVRFVDIDSPPLELAKEIQRSEVVYSSSLHGLVFAHALERPAVLVHPQTQEPLTKYEDYHLGAGLPWRSPALDIFEALRPPPPTSPVTLTYEADDFALPSLAELRDHGVVE